VERVELMDSDSSRPCIGIHPHQIAGQQRVKTWGFAFAKNFAGSRAKT
jgi:hypothetical protein